MRISQRWLRRYVDIRLSPGKLAEDLSMLGLEVESFEDLGKRYEGFVVGKVLDAAKHPNADRLTVCKVDVGKQELQIVCGAPNVAAGQNVPVGLEGATVPRNQHDPNGEPFVLSRVKLRGVESRGMICSEYELGLGDDRDGIMVFEGSAKPGTPLATHLRQNDVVYDLEITANRGDWLSHFGVAREISAMTGKPWKKPALAVRESKEPVRRHLSVKILDKEKCRRYAARVIRNVHLGPSPDWMQDLLLAVGVRPINNIVDCTNFVMLETGQPLHAFDYDRIAGKTIIVRTAKQGDSFTTLDGKARTLTDETLMICDKDRPVAMGGVMGGENSEIQDGTVNVLLESAWFDASNIRKTSKGLGLSTDASQRFERSIDPEMTLYAVHRAAQLIQETAGGEVLKGVLDVYPKKRRQQSVKVRVSRTNDILGTSLSRANIISYLKRLGIGVKGGSGNAILVSVPSHRSDLEEEIDFIEEVARMYGYNNIDTPTGGRISFSSGGNIVDPEQEITEYLIGCGFNEIVTNSLQNKAHAQLAGDPPIEVLNPVSRGMEMLRTSLIPGALDVIQHNYNHGERGIRFFEVGRVYKRIENASLESLEGFREENRLLIVLSGDTLPQHFSAPVRKYDFMDLKGEVESFLLKFLLDKGRLIYYDNDKPLSVNNIDVEIQGTYAGYLGTLKKEIAARFEIGEEVFFCELRSDVLSTFWDRKKSFEELPRFPSVTRDLAFIVDQELPQSEVEAVIVKEGGELLRRVTLFDLYVGEQVGAGKKSLAYSLEFQPRDRTLTDQEVGAIVSRVVDQVGAVCHATLRA